MTTYPIVRFVAAVGDTTPVLDLNEPRDGLAVMHEGFSLGSPSFDAAPRSVGAVYGERTLTGTMRVYTDQASAARLMQAFATEVLKPSNVLMFQLDAASEPMWARTWQTEQEPLSLENTSLARPERRFDLPYQLTADAYFYGAPVDLGSYTVTNNPSSTTYTVTPVNLAPNPSAEVSTAGWSPSTGSIQRVTVNTTITQGSWVFASAPTLPSNLVVSQTSGWRSPVTPGQPYSVGLTVQRFVGTMSARLRLRWFSAVSGGSQVGATIDGPVTAFANAQARRLVREGLTAPAGAQALEVGIVVSAASAGGALTWDGLMVNRGPSVVAYADGSTAGWGWSGTPHLSASGPMSDSPLNALPGRVALPPVPGDTPALLSMRVLPSTAWSNHDVVAHVTAFSDPSDAAATVFPLDGTWTAPSGLGATNGDPSMVSGQHRATTAATTTLSTPEAVVRPGAYRVYLRMAKEASTAPTVWAASLSSGGAKISDPALGVYDAGVSSGWRAAYVDLGEVTLPRATDARRLTGGAATFPLSLTLTRVSGTAGARLDALVLVPVAAARIANAGRTTLEFRALDAPAVGTNGITAVIDSEERAAWQESSAGIASGAPAIGSGGFPQVWPGADNVLHLFQQARSRGPAAASDGDSVTASCTVKLWCSPGYLYLATGA